MIHSFAPAAVCMVCCQEVDDAAETEEEDGVDILWVYCAKCDCWTEHPFRLFDDGQMELWSEA